MYILGMGMHFTNQMDSVEIQMLGRGVYYATDLNAVAANQELIPPTDTPVVRQEGFSRRSSGIRSNTA